MGRIRKTVPRKADPPRVDPIIQEERQRIAEHLVREFRKAGYECSLGDDITARRLKRDH